MSNVVFILGAGASRQAGAPLMNDFLDVARGLCTSGEAGDAKPSFELVFKGLNALQNVHSKSMMDIHNLESVFAAFEMASILGKCPGLDTKEIEQLVPAISKMIAKTVEVTLQLPVAQCRIVPPAPYDSFVRLVVHLREKVRKTVAVLTFNYDLAIDHAFYCGGLPFGYHLPRERCPQSDTSLLKLHGSMNWAICSKCGEVVAWPLGDFFRAVPYDPDDLGRAKLVQLRVASNLGRFRHCSAEPSEPRPYLVPPTWSKKDGHHSLSTVWQRAAVELGEAEDIFVIGYSLAEADSFFRYLYALGTVGGAPLGRFWVFDPDETGSVNRRFSQLLGPGAQARYRYHRMPFDTAISCIGSEYRFQG